VNAFVLAAGAGSRLRPYTDAIPKPMLDVGGAPILGYAIDALVDAGFDNIILNLHYLPDVIRAYVGDGRAFGATVTYSEEEHLLGTAGALDPVRAMLQSGGTFAIVFGDNVIDVDVRDVVRKHRAKNAVATVAVWSRDDVQQSGVAELDPDDRITRFVEKPAPGESDSHWVNAGLIIAEPRLLEAIPRGGPSDLGRDVLPALVAAGELVYAYRMSGGLWWFDRPDEYVAARTDRALLDYCSAARRHTAR
jgi:NDP-sugar pyrophosphorylase family protein